MSVTLSALYNRINPKHHLPLIANVRAKTDNGGIDRPIVTRMFLGIRRFGILVIMICLLMPLPAVAQTTYKGHELFWDIREGQMVNCTLTWHLDFGGLPAVNSTLVLGNITELIPILDEFSELPYGRMTFYWPNCSIIEYDSTSSWRHNIGSTLLPLGNWSLVTNLLNATCAITEETDSAVSIYSLFVPHPELPATWKKQTISKSDGFFLNLTLGYEYPNETITHFATIIRTGSLFTPTAETTHTNGGLQSPSVLIPLALAMVVVIVIAVATKHLTKM